MERMTLLDVAQRTDPNGVIPDLVEVLNKQNNVLPHIPFVETNRDNSLVFKSRAALPSVHRRRFNQGYKASKSRVSTVEEACGMVVGRAEIDKALAEMNGNVAAVRYSEDKAFMESFAQDFSKSFFYASDKTNVDQVTGMAPRLDSLSGYGAEQIVSAGTPGDNTNTSIWGVIFGTSGVHGIYPRGTKAGLSHNDRGILDVNDENGDPYPAYVTDWEWKYGFAVRNVKKIVRIANIDTRNLEGIDLLEQLIKASYRLDKAGEGRLVWFCNKTIAQALDLQARREVQTGGQLGYTEVDGKPVVEFRKSPILEDDAILDTEAAVV